MKQLKAIKLLSIIILFGFFVFNSLQGANKSHAIISNAEKN